MSGVAVGAGLLLLVVVLVAGIVCDMMEDWL